MLPLDQTESLLEQYQHETGRPMSRALNVTLTEREALALCESEKVGVSAIETLPQGGVRLVCMSMDGAETLRRKLKSRLIKGEVVRERIRPRSPLW